MIPLNAMTVLWTVLVPLADEVPDPEDVKPGWLGFGVFLLLAAAVVFLVFSFRKQLRKVNFEEPKNGDKAETPDGEQNGPDGEADAPRSS
ncbi:MAG TPA: hypothetical protein VLB29_08160 [Nocardioidaceae bacterium]|nr:hypothetical protein [Nocardioidaceae bacterium]